jgi:hypothetical protein
MSKKPGISKIQRFRTSYPSIAWHSNWGQSPHFHFQTNPMIFGTIIIDASQFLVWSDLFYPLIPCVFFLPIKLECVLPIDWPNPSIQRWFLDLFPSSWWFQTLVTRLYDTYTYIYNLYIIIYTYHIYIYTYHIYIYISYIYTYHIYMCVCAFIIIPHL